MACGKPVVGYRHGGICEMVKEGENDYLAIPNQPAELYKANQGLTDNTEKREIRSCIGNNKVIYYFMNKK